LEDLDLSTSDIQRRAESFYKKLLKDRKETIARTEMRHGTSVVNAADAQARGAKFKVWQTSGDELVSDECQANEAQGPIDVNSEFSGGVQTPPQHVNCRCTVSYGSNDAVKDVYADRAEARTEKTAAAKEGT